VPEKIKESSNIETTNDYAAAITVQIPPQISKLLIRLKEENTNNILFKIQGSMDEEFTDVEELKSETQLTKNSSTYETLGEPWLFVRVMHKAAVADTQGKTSCVISASGAD
jgi:hypothetical protein